MKIPDCPLDVHDIRILAVLDEGGGTVTADVSRALEWRQGRKHSAILSRRIRYLERHGLVGRLDAETPIAWTRTAEGTAAMSSCVVMPAKDDPAPSPLAPVGRGE